MRQILIIILLIAISCSCTENQSSKKKPVKIKPKRYQNISTDSLAKLITTELQEDGIDTLIAYKYSCSIGDPINYLFWEKNGHKYFQEINAANNRLPEPNDSSVFITTILANLNRIRKEEIGPPQHIIKKRKSGNIMRVSMIDHYCLSEISIRVDTVRIKKSINHYNLEAQRVNDKTPNDNYEPNQKTILKQLITILEKEIGLNRNQE